MTDKLELRDQLKSQNLDTVEPSAFKFVGGTVFPDHNAKEDLNDFVEVMDSFKATHLPTNGAIPIPHTEQTIFKTLTTSSDSITFLIPGTNEVYEIVSVYAVVPANYSIGNAFLGVGQSGSPIADLGDIDAHTNSFSGLVYGAIIDGTQSSQIRSMFTPRKLYVVAGSSLTMYVANSPSSNADFGCLIRKVMQ